MEFNNIEFQTLLRPTMAAKALPSTPLESFYAYGPKEPKWTPYDEMRGFPKKWRDNYMNEVMLHTKMTRNERAIWAAIFAVHMCEDFDMKSNHAIGVYRGDIDIGVRSPQHGETPSPEFQVAIALYVKECKDAAVLRLQKLKDVLATACVEAGKEVSAEVEAEYERRKAQWDKWANTRNTCGYDGTPWINPFPYY